MGFILDSSVLIPAERRGLTVRQMIAGSRAQLGDVEVGLSVVSLIELAHGVARADSMTRKANREGFLRDLITALPIHPVSVSLALRTGHLNGDLQSKGIHLASADLLIGMTALELGFGVATSNVKHFGLIPGLRIVLL